MHFLAFLFFTGLLGAALLMIRTVLVGAGDKIGAALAGDYRLATAQPAPVYIARRRPTRTTLTTSVVRRRIAA